MPEIKLFLHNKVDRFINKFFTLLFAQVKYIVYLWRINFSAVLSFLRENSLKKETLEELLGFDLNLKGSYNFTLSELKSLEIYTNLDLCSLKNI